jgi:acetolactate synthase small subunit
MSFETASDPLNTNFINSVKTAERTLFFVLAAPDPGSLSRIIEPFAKRGLVPASLSSRHIDEELRVEIEMEGMDPSLAAYIGRCLQEIFVVRSVYLTPSFP